MFRPLLTRKAPRQ